MGFGFLLPLGLSFPVPFLLFVFCTSPFLQLLYYFFSLMGRAGSYHSLCTLLVSDLFSLGFPKAFVDELKSGGVCSQPTSEQEGEELQRMRDAFFKPPHAMFSDACLHLAFHSHLHCPVWVHFEFPVLRQQEKTHGEVTLSDSKPTAQEITSSAEINP